MENKQIEKIISSLDIIAKILAYNAVKDFEKKGDKMWFLHSIGISNQDIALLLGTTSDSVKSTLSQMRNPKKKNSDSEQE